MPERLFATKYRLHDLLGKGGMGEVYAATNTVTKAKVAIKCMPPHLAGPELAGRMQQEAEALAVLIHPNIVRLYDAGTTDEGVFYIVMERVDGEPLRKLIEAAKKQGIRLDTQLVLHVMAQIADAMDLAHRKGIVHRDIKPENIMVAPGGKAVLLDFGIAKHSQGAELPAPPVQTDPASVVGTALYMAPERIRGRAFDGRADIYAMGVTLYEALSGKRPYDAYEDASTTMTEIMGHHVFSEPTPIRELVPGCPERVWRLLQRCLAKDPAERFATMGELATALRAALREHVLAIASTPRDGHPTVVAEPAKVREVAVRPQSPPSFGTPGRRVLLGKGHTFKMTPAAPREVRTTEPPVLGAQPPRDPLPFAAGKPVATERVPAPLEVRVTEPPPINFQPPRDPLPFSSPRPIAPELAPAPREARMTEPGPQDLRVRNAVPFVMPVSKRPPVKFFEKGPPPGEAPSSEGDRHAVLLPAAPPVASPMRPPVQPIAPVLPAPERDRAEAHPTPSTQTPPASTTSQAPRKREYILIPLAGLVVAAALLVVVMVARAPHGPASATTGAAPVEAAAPPQPSSAPTPVPTHLPSAGPSSSARPLPAVRSPPTPSSRKAAPRRRPGADR